MPSRDYFTSGEDGTDAQQAQEYIAEVVTNAAITGSVTGSSVSGDNNTGSVTYEFNMGGNIDKEFNWLSNPMTKKPIWEIEEDIEEYRARMNREIQPRYEIPQMKHMHTGRDYRDYYHLYKHRSF